MPIVVGVLALQGAFKEHVDALNSLDIQGSAAIKAKLVRDPNDLIGIDGLILPGGESTVMHKLLHTSGLHSPIKDWISSDRPTFGTCAGLILMADRIAGKDGPLLGGLRVTVMRNAYGRQLESFTTKQVQIDGKTQCTGMFIRAPSITAVGRAQIIARLNSTPVGVQQGNLVGLAFHPELTDNLFWHEQFISIIQDFKAQ